MQTESANSLSYELGVLAFQLLSRHAKALKVENEFDAESCLSAICGFLRDETDKTEFLVGFVSECANNGVSEQETTDLYLICRKKLDF